MTEYNAVVYDLDGTLVDLAVDWDAVAQEGAELLEAEGVTVDGTDLWGMLDLADDIGVRPSIERTISKHERRGAERSTRLPTATELPRSVPVAVCSLNCEAACRLALKHHDIATHVETVIGRDTVTTRKPDPEPLLAAVRQLDRTPEKTLFVGDSQRDKLTADRAGTAYRYV
ncbi:HAD family hydrolase [Halocatena pleomorpha]|uniref:HAD family hydrolase n=1 Tax=Halocatena pleomorpha TaxID=1785090 RepID=A0A3P3RJQ4_9EURY|nr:HAD hydrolase-like protein [Halocatena pleomorpha]RRJ33554.1 HAD family hydrolase [Halocatena pleomorpha]